MSEIIKLDQNSELSNREKFYFLNKKTILMERKDFVE